jgi:hypothetical protein
LRFTTCQPKDWRGRYGRIPGNRSVFHLRRVGGRKCVVIEWHRDGCIGTCVAVDTAESRKIVSAVANAKRLMGGGDAGAFLVNEFGQVLVPSSEGDGRRLIVGMLEGTLHFIDPFTDGRLINLDGDSSLQCGDPWDLPYVGSQYNLSSKSEIYFFKIGGEGGTAEKPPMQDRELIGALRRVRRTGAVRFIVNPHGLVLTRCPPQGAWSPEEEWSPVYVGRIRPDSWFKKEG